MGRKVVALEFISEAQATHPFYKHLLKHNIAKMSDVLSRAQPYIQLEEVMKASSNHSAKPRVEGGKSKIPQESPDHTPDQH